MVYSALASFCISTAIIFWHILVIKNAFGGDYPYWLGKMVDRATWIFMINAIIHAVWIFFVW